MLARLSVLALCAVAAIATGAAANPAGLSAEICVGRLAEKLKDVTVPADIKALVAAVEADEKNYEWGKFEEVDSHRFDSIYPAASCKEFLARMEERFAAALENDDCSRQLPYSDKALGLSKENPVIGPIMDANAACDDFEPIPAGQQ